MKLIFNTCARLTKGRASKPQKNARLSFYEDDMESGYIQYVLDEIKEAIDKLNARGIRVGYPKEVEIELSGVKIVVPWV